MPSLSYALARILLEAGLSYAEIARRHGISRSAVYQKLHPEKRKLRERDEDKCREANKRYRERNADELRERRRQRYANKVISTGRVYRPQRAQVAAE